ncbi:GNAT family N-acetyltransferase [Patescibacteria group bacterium]|nr:GNAT family N-acetyltransferase [Patescibacteria group bacterium]
MKFEIVQLNEDLFKSWNQFCFKSPYAWFWHTTNWQTYILNRTEFKPELLSFIVIWQNKIVAIVPLIAEILNSGIKEFSFEGWASPPPIVDKHLSAENKEIVYKFIFDQIKEIARKKGIMRASFFNEPLIPDFLKNQTSLNNLLKYGYADISLNSRLINLNKKEDELWSDMRRNHHRNIRKVEQFKVKFYGAKDISEEIFGEYKKMHHLAAGRKTRPDKTFELMYEWLKEDWAFLATVEFKDRPIGFEYYSVYKNNVYGFSAVNDPDYEAKYPIRHILEWQSILWMKKLGFDYYEIGLQHPTTTLPYDSSDKKQLNISHFKEGFGGFEVPLYIVERFFDRDYFLQINKERILKYAAFLENNQF